MRGAGAWLRRFLVGRKGPARMCYGRVVVPVLAARQDEFIAVSRSTAQVIERFFSLPSERVRIIHNGLDHTRFCPGNSAAARHQASVSWGLDRPFFLYLSRLEHPGKNHNRLIDACYRRAATAANATNAVKLQYRRL